MRSSFDWKFEGSVGLGWVWYLRPGIGATADNVLTPQIRGRCLRDCPLRAGILHVALKGDGWRFQSLAFQWASEYEKSSTRFDRPHYPGPEDRFPQSFIWCLLWAATSSFIDLPPPALGVSNLVSPTKFVLLPDRHSAEIQPLTRADITFTSHTHGRFRIQGASWVACRLSPSFHTSCGNRQLLLCRRPQYEAHCDRL
ncbi:hypothetical protein BDW66DRAFT_36422 [Aspergillus desertorum]